MCGIACFIKKSGDPLLRSEIVFFETLLSRLDHRGPDEKNIHTINDNILFGHTRLSINGISNGTQPFIGGDGSTTIVNGEIYNYQSVAKSLGINTLLKTNSDCEILTYFSRYPDMLSSLTGMYSFIHYDSFSDTIYFARDRFGEKPLYIYEDSDKYVLCSELKPLANTLGLGLNSLSTASLVEYLMLGYVCKENTIFDSISSVSRATLFSLSSSRSLSHSPILYESDESVDDYQFTCDYVQSSLLSEQPIAIGLSGGVDSTLLAYLARDQVSKAYTVGYEAPGGEDELSEAKETCHKLGIDFESILILDCDVPSLFIDQVKRKDSLILDFAGIAYNSIYSAMSIDGFKVAIMGHGGDEIGIGYQWYRDSYVNTLNGMNMLYETQSDFRTYFSNLRHILCIDTFNDIRWSRYPAAPSNNIDPHVSIFNNIVDFWLEPNSLRMGDSLSMSYGIESRHPLLATRVESLMPSSTLFLEKKLYRNLLSELSGHYPSGRKKHFAQPYMHYYNLIHLSRPSPKDSILKELNLFNHQFLNAGYCNDNFENSIINYYYYAKLATLDFWLTSFLA